MRTELQINQLSVMHMTEAEESGLTGLINFF